MLPWYVRKSAPNVPFKFPYAWWCRAPNFFDILFSCVFAFIVQLKYQFIKNAICLFIENDVFCRTYWNSVLSCTYFPYSRNGIIWYFEYWLFLLNEWKCLKSEFSKTLLKPGNSPTFVILRQIDLQTTLTDYILKNKFSIKSDNVRFLFRNTRLSHIKMIWDDFTIVVFYFKNIAQACILSARVNWWSDKPRLAIGQLVCPHVMLITFYYYTIN